MPVSEILHDYTKTNPDADFVFAAFFAILAAIFCIERQTNRVITRGKSRLTSELNNVTI